MSPPLEHVSQSPSGEALEAEIAVFVRQCIPAAALVRFGEAGDDLGQAKVRRRRGKDVRSAVHGALVGEFGDEKPATGPSR